MGVRLVIFDLDGTLLDTVGDLGDAVNYSLRCCSLPERPMDDYKILCGRGIANLLRGAVPEDSRTPAVLSRMAECFYPRYRSHIADRTRPYEGIPEMMERLAARGILFAVASNKYQEGAETLIRKFFGQYDFVRILGQREDFPLKPDPAVVDLIIDAVPGLDRGEVVYCGDSDVDMLTGSNAGVRTAGVLWGFRSREELEAHHPWLIADSPASLADAILSL